MMFPSLRSSLCYCRKIFISNRRLRFNIFYFIFSFLFWLKIPFQLNLGESVKTNYSKTAALSNSNYFEFTMVDLKMNFRSISSRFEYNFDVDDSTYHVDADSISYCFIWILSLTSDRI